MTEQFEQVGVIIERDSAGRFAAKLIFLKGGKVLDQQVLTEDRALSPALRVAREGLDQISMRLSRREYNFVEKQ